MPIAPQRASPPRDRRFKGAHVVLPAVLLVLTSATGWAKTGEATFSRLVPAGEWAGIKLANLPATTTINVSLETDGELIVAVTDESFANAGGTRTKPLFAARATDRLDFAVTTVRDQDHYLILDNRAGDAARDVQVAVRAATGPDVRNGVTPPAVKASPAANETLSRFESALHQLFIFEPFSVATASCDQPNVWTTPTRVVLCTEYVSRVQSEVQDAAVTREVLVFALFHEVGHMLLRQWDYPFYDSEDVADQFATAVLMLLGQDERLTPVIGMFAARSPAMESAIKLKTPSPHPLSAQRAANIARWRSNPDFLRRWQSVFLPRFQTAYMQRMLAGNDPRLDRALLEKELKSR